MPEGKSNRFEMLREPNNAAHSEQQIVKIIRERGPLSRKEIARHLRVSVPTVSSSVAKLLSVGIIREIGSSGSGRGRKSALLEYNRDSGYVVGIDVGGKYIRTALSNMMGEIVSKTEIPTLAYQGADSVVARVIRSIDDVGQHGEMDTSPLLAIGLGLPGVLDSEQDDVILSPFLDRTSASRLITILRGKYGVPVRVENDVNMAVIGEKWRGAARGYKNIVYANLGLGFSCGIIIGGELYRGASGAAGETGFMVLEKTQLRNDFCTKGSLEQRIAGEGIVAALLRRLEQQGRDPDTVLPAERDAEAVFALAARGDELAQAVLDETLTYFAMALTNVVAVLNPEIVVIGGALGIALADELESIAVIMQHHVPRVPKLVVSALGTTAGVYGAVAVALRTGRERIGCGVVSQ